MKNLMAILFAVGCCTAPTNGYCQNNYYGANFAAPDDAAHNTAGNIILIDNSASNFDSTAILLESPSTTNLITANAKFSSLAAYDYSAEKWTLLNETVYDNPIPTGMNFNVLIPSAHGHAFQDEAITISANYTDIDNPATNGNPGALLFIKQVWKASQPASMVFDSIPTGVWYNTSTGKWSIFHENINVPIAPHETFNVFVADTSGGRAFVHTTTALDTVSRVSYFSSPYTDGNPSAILIVTQNFSAAGRPFSYDSVPVGLYYNGRQWGIYHQDLSNVKSNVSYNVLVANAPGTPTTGMVQNMVSEAGLKVWPNPVNENTFHLHYNLNQSSEVSLKLFAANGTELLQIYNGHQEAGEFDLEQKVPGQAPGLYYIVLETESEIIHTALSVQ